MTCIFGFVPPAGGGNELQKGQWRRLRFPILGWPSIFRDPDLSYIRTKVLLRACPFACRFIAARGFPFEDTVEHTIS